MSALKAGAAQLDITPPLGTQLAGDIGRHRPLTKVREPAFAKVVVMQTDGCKLALIQLDLFGLSAAWGHRIRGNVAEKIGTEPGAVLVCGTQNHGAPCIDFGAYAGNRYIPEELGWLRGGDEAYATFVTERILEATARANAELQPVSLGAASGAEGRVAFNRRFIMRDGSVTTHPTPCSEEIRYCEGPIDPEVGIVCLLARSGEVIAALLHFTCHPNHGYPQRFLTSDWPGAWSDEVRGMLNDQCVALVLNGCCGNIHHRNHLDPDYVADYKRMGKLLAETTAQSLPRVEYSETAKVAASSRLVSLPYRQLDADKMREVRELLSRYPTPLWLNEERTRVSWDWVYAVSLMELEADIAKDPHYRYEVQVLRIGDVALLGLGGEPFVEGQLQIKMNSPARQTYIAHMANDACGYIPTAAAFERGGYETNVCQWSKFAPEALETIVEAATQMLRSIYV